MKKNIKFIFYVLLTIPCITVGFTSAGSNNTSTLQSYSSIRSALISGESVSAVTFFNKCDNPKGDNNSIGGMHINSFLMPNDKYIAFSDYHQSLKDNNEVSSVTEFIRYTVTEDNYVSIKIIMLDSLVKNIPHPMEYRCKIGEGSMFYVTD